MRFLKIIAFTLIASLLSCSGEDPDPTPPSEKPKEFQLSTKIIGVWEVDNTTSNSQEANIKQEAGTPCYIFSFIFNADGTFIIHYRYGTLEGEYDVIDETSISLNSNGKISEINFSDDAIYFSAELNGICSTSFQCNKVTYNSAGNCFTFLKCNDEKVWKMEENGQMIFLKFLNYSQGTWMRKFRIENGRNCYTVQNNQLDDATLIMTRNIGNSLIYIRETETGNEIYNFMVNTNGYLELKIETVSEDTIEIYKPTDQAELNTYLSYSECGAKTYIPDDIFEQKLIDSGLDNVMDDYVLTENIVDITGVAFYNWEIRDLTGIQDFIALKDLYVQPAELFEIDLTKNVNLERLFLSSQEMTELDISKNTNLESFYFEFGQIESIDFSKNPNLKFIEIHGTTISSLDISVNKKLEMLTVEGGNLTSVTTGTNESLWHINLSFLKISEFDPSLFPNLKELLLGDNQLSEIDLTSSKFLESLDLSKNLFTQIDLSGNPELKEFTIAQNDLNSLDLSNNPDLYRFYGPDNTNLECIQVTQGHLDRINNNNSYLNWVKDEGTTFSLDCGY